MPQNILHLFPASLWLPILGNILTGLVAGYIAGVVAPRANHHYSEITRTRDRDLEREKERQAKELENQRHRLDIYKTIFAEQIIVAKQLSGLMGTQYHETIIFLNRLMHDHDKKELERSTIEVMNRSMEIVSVANGNRWLLGDAVADLAQKFVGLIDGQAVSGVGKLGMDAQEIGRIQRLVRELFESTNKALSEHMQVNSRSALATEVKVLDKPH